MPGVCARLVSTGLACLLLWAPLSVRADVAEIVSLVGRGEYHPSHADAWQDAHVRQGLDADDLVRTADLSTMAILFADRTQIRLARNSLMKIKGGPGTAPRLELGRAWAQSKTPPAGFRMETPAATVAIRGTDWEVEVAPGGEARVTVLHGEIELYNDQGRLTVAAGEQALAVPGRAPVKLLLQNPAERVQWVTAYRVDPRRYPELRTPGALREVGALIDAGRNGEAAARLRALAQGPTPPPAALLLLADFAIMSGDLEEAGALLRRGTELFPREPRFPAGAAQVLLLRDDLPAARRLLDAALARDPQAVELLLMAGELERFAGAAGAAAAAYGRAAALAPGDARPWHGLGVVESGREEIKRARSDLLAALARDDGSPGTRGELATVETFANQFDAADEQYRLALAARPDDYVALTGLGLMELKRGRTDAALEALLRANLIEPRYARAVVYLAVAYYQLGRHHIALETLHRASELDPRDPLPHLLASLIHTDRVEPGKAVDEARTALRLMPYLKSLNQVANDQKGAANLGNAMAQFGMEDWALGYAQASYDPFWAGSHLFLADRYRGGYDKQSELMQGYTTDPTAFGASNRFQTLVPTPGSYLSLGVLANQSRDGAVTTPNFIGNGYALPAFPLAWFVEGQRIRMAPGDNRTDGTGAIVTAALGALPREDVGLFGFAGSFDADLTLRNVPGVTERVVGRQQRLDLGLNFKFGAASQSWLKLGTGEEEAQQERTERSGTRNGLTRLDYRPRNQDLQYRHSLRVEQDEWSWGAEATQMDKDALTTTDVTTATLTSHAVEQRTESDRSFAAYLGDRRRLTDALLVDAALHYGRYDKHTDTASTQAVAQSGVLVVDATHRDDRREGLFPRLGAVFAPRAGEAWRFAWQSWLRPKAPDTLSPVATAGIPLDDQLVLPGGRLERLRAQWEQELGADTFVTLFADGKRAWNLGEPGDVFNQRIEAADLDRLRNRAALVFQASGEALEEQPVFLEGRVLSAGAGLNRRLTDNLSASADYVYRDSANTHPWFKGLALPYLPRHQVTLGSTWAGPQRSLVQAIAVYRSERFIDEAHNAGLLAAGWDAALKASWQSPDKHWLVEAYGLNLLNKESAATLGVNLAWRY